MSAGDSCPVEWLDAADRADELDRAEYAQSYDRRTPCGAAKNGTDGAREGVGVPATDALPVHDEDACPGCGNPGPPVDLGPGGGGFYRPRMGCDSCGYVVAGSPEP